jgi:colanic acid biosynthesis glycosyl transferase WcaI
MRVIFVNRYFAPDESATSRMVTSLAFGLAEHGCQVIALTGRSGRDRDGPCLPRRENRGGVRIHRLPTVRPAEAGLAGRVADQAGFQLAVAVWCLAHLRRGDILVACTDPPLISVTLAPIAAARGARLVNWLHDIYPEIAIELGVLSRGSAMARLTLTLRDWSLRRATLNIVPTNSMVDGLRRRGMPRDRLTTLPYWSEDEIGSVPPTENALRAEWGLREAFVVGYSGNFGRAHEFDTLLEAATLLRGETQIRFLLIGGGHGRDHIESEVRRRELTNVVLRPLQPRARLAESLSAADLHLISLQPTLEPYVVPSKLYGIMAAGRPAIFIGAADGEVATTLRRNGCGETVAIGAGADLAARIAALRDDHRRIATMGIGARQTFEARHRRDDAINAWIALLAALAGREGAEAPYSAASGDAMKG